MPTDQDANAWRDTEILEPRPPGAQAGAKAKREPQADDRDPARRRRTHRPTENRHGAAAERPPRGPRRRSSRPSARSLERRARRRRRAWAAAAALGLVAVLAVGGLYQVIGGAQGPGQSATLANAGSGGTSGAQSSPAAPLLTTAERPGDAASAASIATGGAPSVPFTASTVPGPGSNATPVGPAPVPTLPAATTATAKGPVPRVTTAGREATAEAILPFMPGSQVVESDAEPQAVAGGGSTWAATLSMQGQLDQAVAFYRQQLSRGTNGQTAGAALTEVNPGPGQVLMSVGNPADGSHSAVWIGTVDGQLLIRLMRTQAQAATP